MAFECLAPSSSLLGSERDVSWGQPSGDIRMPRTAVRKVQKSAQERATAWGIATIRKIARNNRTVSAECPCLTRLGMMTATGAGSVCIYDDHLKFVSRAKTPGGQMPFRIAFSPDGWKLETR